MSKPKDDDPMRAQMRTARRALGWSLEVAERKTDIPGVVVGSWERGDRSPTLPQLRRWAAAFGRTLAMLEPDEFVVSTSDSGGAQKVLQFLVVYGPGPNDHIECDGKEEAEHLATRIAGARLGQRVIARGPITFEEAS